MNLSKEEKGGGRAERKSFRRKIGLLLRGSAAELPAVINRSLQPIRRSLSFSKDLNRVQEPSKPHRATSAHWYNSLVSLAEDECLDEYDDSPSGNNSPTIEERLFSSKVQVTRTQSLIDTTFVRVVSWRKTYRSSLLRRVTLINRSSFTIELISCPDVVEERIRTDRIGFAGTRFSIFIGTNLFSFIDPTKKPSISPLAAR